MIKHVINICNIKLEIWHMYINGNGLLNVLTPGVKLFSLIPNNYSENIMGVSI